MKTRCPEQGRTKWEAEVATSELLRQELHRRNTKFDKLEAQVLRLEADKQSLEQYMKQHTRSAAPAPAPDFVRDEDKDGGRYPTCAI